MKNQWKAVFLIRIDDMFTTMSLELKESILGIGNANRYDLFSQKIEDVESTWMNKLNDDYSDIKFEIKAIEDYLN